MQRIKAGKKKDQIEKTGQNYTDYSSSNYLTECRNPESTIDYSDNKLVSFKFDYESEVFNLSILLFDDLGRYPKRIQ